jgi:uncharacterized RDD family membrane protein YckC
MDEEIYTPPQSDLSVAPEENVLASRWSRLGASMIDGLSIMVVTVPVMYFTGGFENIMEGTQPSHTYNLTIGILGIIIFFIINTKLLINKGQTIGKLALGIKIVDLDNNLPELKNHLLKRYATYLLPGQVPLIGQLFSFVNVAFIFGKQKRCIHDHVAGTKVINA